MADLKPLIRYIVDQVNEQGGAVGRTALMKLVYLIDVEHYRSYGKQATGLKWRFHHYGPYAAELDADVRSLDLDVDEHIFNGKIGNRLASGYQYHRTGDWRDIEGAFNARFDASAKRCVDKVIEQWGLDSLPTILDYVYFETEPMQDAKRGEYLDFSKISVAPAAPPVTAKLAFSGEFFSNMRQRLEEKREKKRESIRKATEPRYDEIYIEACKLMASEDKDLILLPEARTTGPGEE